MDEKILQKVDALGGYIDQEFGKQMNLLRSTRTMAVITGISSIVFAATTSIVLSFLFGKRAAESAGRRM